MLAHHPVFQVYFYGQHLSASLTLLTVAARR
jgi:hypothetical protein